MSLVEKLRRIIVCLFPKLFIDRSVRMIDAKSGCQILFLIPLVLAIFVRLS